MSEEKTKIGIGHNSKNNYVSNEDAEISSNTNTNWKTEFTPLTDRLLKVSESLERVFQSLSKNYTKYSAVKGNTYTFDAGGVDDVEVRKPTQFEKDQLHFEAQGDQQKCLKTVLKQVWELKTIRDQHLKEQSILLDKIKEVSSNDKK